MKTIPLILVGGFLGAGKTTLIAQAAQRLLARGQRAGLITNDQAAHLVDTAVLQAAGAPVCEVAGGCFCCRFDELIAAMDRLMQDQSPDVLIGEPVGSCTDLSATVLQPMKALHRDRYRVAPFSVLVDVKQVRTLQRLRAELQRNQAARFPDDVMYIYQKQLEEADLIVLNKGDLLSPAELATVEQTLRMHFARAPVMTISARSGEGIDAWLKFVLQERPAGRTIAAVDYDQYAAGEAALGWLNAAVRLQADGAMQWERFCLALMNGLQAEFQNRSAEVAHLKLHLSAGEGALVANLTSNDGTVSLHGTIGGDSRQARLLVNARVHLDPQTLQTLLERQLRTAATAAVQVTIDALRSFAPSRPQPKHRYAAVV